MKRICALVCIIVLLTAMSGCSCSHEWSPATCDAPKTCSLCGETEGVALGHTWEEADCDHPQTCARCGETHGEALGHDWVDADCENAKTCVRCAAVEGDALGHDWADATLDAPKTCTRCAQTDGYPLSPDARFDTQLCEPIFGTWRAAYHPSADSVIEGFSEFLSEIPAQMELSFGANAIMTMTITFTDMQVLADAMNRYTVDMMYDQFAEMGIDRDAADEAFMEVYEISIEEYVARAMEDVDMSDVFADSTVQFVYYLDGETLYLAQSWESEFETDTFTLNGDTLTVDIYADGSDPVDFARIDE